MNVKPGIQFTIKRLLMSIAAIGLGICVWTVDLKMGSTSSRDLTAELFMIAVLYLRPLTVFVATIAVLGLRWGTRIGILIVFSLVAGYSLSLLLHR